MISVSLSGAHVPVFVVSNVNVIVLPELKSGTKEAIRLVSDGEKLPPDNDVHCPVFVPLTTPDIDIESRSSQTEKSLLAMARASVTIVKVMVSCSAKQPLPATVESASSTVPAVVSAGLNV